MLYKLTSTQLDKNRNDLAIICFLHISQIFPFKCKNTIFLPTPVIRPLMYLKTPQHKVFSACKSSAEQACALFRIDLRKQKAVPEFELYLN